MSLRLYSCPPGAAKAVEAMHADITVTIAYLRVGGPPPPLTNLGQEENGIAYLGASPGALTFKKTLHVFCDAIWVA